MGRTGPRNFPGSGMIKARGARVRKSRASMPSMSAARAAGGHRPGNGGGSGIPKATSPMALAASRKINKPKTGGARKFKARVHADGNSRI